MAIGLFISYTHIERQWPIIILSIQGKNTYIIMSLSDFVILSKIGQGSFSSVHKVSRMSDKKIYALKQVKIASLKEKQKQNALNEVRILASISCPNIIGYKEAFYETKTNTLCIVMEFANGGDLEKLIEKKKKNLAWVPEEEIWRMAKQVLTGLLVLHDMNIIHRDLKCANIFISDGVYKLGDLNVSKLMKQSLAYTQTGTPYYASPEVWNDKPYELKSDIWSLGCIMYEYCALKPPFTATSMQGLYKKVMRGIYPKIPSSYSDKMERFIAKCLQLDPKNRPTCKQLLSLIPKLQNTEGVHQKSSSETNISLLNTIKVPRNLNFLINELPKSNYETQNEISLKQQGKPRFGHLSQQKLKQIVRQKNPQLNNPYKKNSLRRITPDIVSQNNSINNYHSDHMARLQEQQIQQIINSLPPLTSKKAQKLQPLPRIKIHSEPNDQNYHPLINRLEERRNKNEKNYVANGGYGNASNVSNNYNYNRPNWWG